jgi:hypothetical protein
MVPALCVSLDTLYVRSALLDAARRWYANVASKFVPQCVSNETDLCIGSPASFLKCYGARQQTQKPPSQKQQQQQQQQQQQAKGLEPHSLATAAVVAANLANFKSPISNMPTSPQTSHKPRSVNQEPKPENLPKAQPSGWSLRSLFATSLG